MFSHHLSEIELTTLSNHSEEFIDDNTFSENILSFYEEDEREFIPLSEKHPDIEIIDELSEYELLGSDHKIYLREE